MSATLAPVIAITLALAVPLTLLILAGRESIHPAVRVPMREWRAEEYRTAIVRGWRVLDEASRLAAQRQQTRRRRGPRGF